MIDCKLWSDVLIGLAMDENIVILSLFKIYLDVSWWPNAIAFALYISSKIVSS